MQTYLKSILLASAITLLAPSLTVYAKDQVYGWELMTEQERAEHRTKMQSMKTMEERDRYMMEHHKKMQERAKQRGVSLPDHPHPQNKGMGNKCGGREGMGKGMGEGMGNKCGGK